MKSGFHDPLSPKKIENGKSPWSFKAPAYDERDSCYIRAGNDYGTGFKQPVGHSGNAKQDVPCLPKGRVKTMRIDEAY